MRRASTLPGPKSFAALQVASFALKKTSLLSEYRDKYGTAVYCTVQPGFKTLLQSDPADIAATFRGDRDLLKAGVSNEIVLPLLGDSSILLLDGDEHLQRRKLLLAPFHGDNLQSHRETIRQVAQESVATWPHTKPIALAPLLQDITLEVIIRIVFGVQDPADFERMQKALKHLIDVATNPVLVGLTVIAGPRRTAKMGWIQSLVGKSDRVVYDEIRRRRTAKNLKDRTDILSQLIEIKDASGRGFTDKELRDEMLTLLVAGHETTATSLSWAIERLVRTPTAMQQLRQEIGSATPGSAADGPYLDAVVKEVLRIRPAISMVGRHLTQDSEISGHQVSAGTRIAPCMSMVHTDPKIYPEPELFKPERWLNETPGTYSWIPFGGGVRRCLGASFALLEMKEILAVIVGALELSPVGTRPEPETFRAYILSPARGCKVVAKQRLTAAHGNSASVEDQDFDGRQEPKKETDSAAAQGRNPGCPFEVS